MFCFCFIFFLPMNSFPDHCQLIWDVPFTPNEKIKLQPI
jgi:hypothetical protein